MVRSAECEENLKNYRVDPTPEIVESVSIKQELPELPQIDPEQLLGFRYIQRREDGDYKVEVVCRCQHDATKFWAKIGDDQEEIIDYSNILGEYEQMLNQDDSTLPETWVFESIQNHRKRKGEWQVQVKWSDGSDTWKPLKAMMIDDPITCAQYALQHDLTGWKRLKSYIKREKKFVRMMKQAYLAKVRSKRQGPKYQFGIRVPCNYKEALEIDKLNGNTLWQDACKTEVDQINAYKTFC